MTVYDQQHKEFFDNLPAEEDLPSHVQDFLSDLKQVDNYEKLELVHQYTIGTMDYVTEFDSPEDEIKQFSDLLKTPRGDCDDFAMFSAALLHYAGVEDSSVMFVGGTVNYEIFDEAGQKQEMSAQHAYLAIKEQGHQDVYILDMNASSVFQVSEAKLSADIAFNDFGSDKQLRGSFEVGDVLFSLNSNGEILKSKPAAPDISVEMINGASPSIDLPSLGNNP